MKDVTKIITLINDIKEAKTLIKRSFALSERLGIVMEIIFVCELPMFDIPLFFKGSNKSIDKEKIKTTLKHILKELKIDKDIAVFVYIDDSVDRVNHLIKGNLDLIVLGYKEDILKEFLKDIKNPILTIKRAKEVRSAVTIMNLNSNYKKCLSISNYLFSDIKNSILYDYRFVIDPSMQIDLQNIKELEEENRKKFQEILNFAGIEGQFFTDDKTKSDKLIAHLKEYKIDLLIECSNRRDISLANSLDIDLLYF